MIGKAMLVATSLAAFGTGIIAYIALDHNPMGVYRDLSSGRINWETLTPLLCVWFALLFICALLLIYLIKAAYRFVMRNR